VGGGGGLGGITSGGTGSAAAAAAAVGKTPARRFAELLKVEEIAKGFSISWFRRQVVNVFANGSVAANPEVLLQQLPSNPALYVCLVQAPNSRNWVPVYLGQAQNKSQACAVMFHDDGSFGPKGEPVRYRAMLDLQRRNFAVQIRYRPLKGPMDYQDKLDRYNFALNPSPTTGTTRALELPSGRAVTEYPVVNRSLNELYCKLASSMVLSSSRPPLVTG